MTNKNLPVAKEQCATCPFRSGSPYSHLARDLGKQALSTGSRICHSTGNNNAINKRTGKPPMICRGARDLQLQVLAGIGFLDAPTDEAWEAKRKEIDQ